MFRIFCYAPHEHAEAIAQFLEDQGCLATSWMEGDPLWLVDAVTTEEAPLASWQYALDDMLLRHIGVKGADISLFQEPIPDKDWLQETYRLFPSFTVGDFFIYGSHDTHAVVPPHMIGLEINAATAFGSGEHQTTKGCLLFLQELAKQHSSFQHPLLDLGCGSGILAIAAAKLWHISPYASDNDAEAVRVTQENATLNGVTISCVVSEGMSAFQVQNMYFDGVVANILAAPLIAMASEIAKLLSPKGWLVLSGLRSDQIQDVTQSYVEHGFYLKDQKEQDGWAALLLNRSS